MIVVSGSNGSATLAFVGRLKSAVRDAQIEEPRALIPVVAALMDADYGDRTAPTSRARWAPRRPPTGGWPLLERTGRMRRSGAVRPGPSTITMEYGFPAEYHQRGTPRMVARPPLPRERLSPIWQDAIGKARAAWWRRKVLG